MYIRMTQTKGAKDCQDLDEETKFFRDGFQKLVHRWKNCVENGGDYVQK